MQYGFTEDIKWIQEISEHTSIAGTNIANDLYHELKLEESISELSNDEISLIETLNNNMIHIKETQDIVIPIMQTTDMITYFKENNKEITDESIRQYYIEYVIETASTSSINFITDSIITPTENTVGYMTVSSLISNSDFYWYANL